MEKEITFTTKVRDVEVDKALEYIEEHCGEEEEEGEYRELVEDADADTTLGDIVDHVHESQEVQEHEDEQASEGSLDDEEADE